MAEPSKKLDITDYIETTPWWQQSLLIRELGHLIVRRANARGISLAMSAQSVLKDITGDKGE